METRNYFIIQVNEPGSINVLNNGRYKNSQWMNKARDKAQGLVKAGDLVLMYFASQSIDYKKKLALVFEIETVSSDHTEFTLKKMLELSNPLSYGQIRKFIENGKLSSAFRICGGQGGNIRQIAKTDYEKALELTKDSVIKESDDSIGNVTFWKFSPGPYACYWEDFKNMNVISMGSWSLNLGSLDNYLDAKDLQEKNPKLKPSRNPRNDSAHQLFRFKDEVKAGDVVVAYGNKSIYGFGFIPKESNYQYDEQENVDWWKEETLTGMQHWRPVNWKVIFDEPFPLYNYPELYNDLKQFDTIHKIDPKFYKELKKIMTNNGMSLDSMSVKSKIPDEIYQKMWDLLQVKKQIILYGPPGTGKTWLAKKFIEEHQLKNANYPEENVPSEEIVISDFDGFTEDSFDFLNSLGMNNNKEWLHQNIEGYQKTVRDPLKKITTEIGNNIRKIADNFETNPGISRINKNRFGRSIALYHTHMWSAFYRSKLGDKRKDAQLFLKISKDNLRFGFGFGNYKEATELQEQFRNNVKSEIDFFYSILKDSNIVNEYTFGYATEEGNRASIEIKNKKQLEIWLGKNDLEIVKTFDKNNLPKQGREQATSIFHSFEELFPIYLFATSENSKQDVEEYLEGNEENEFISIKDLSKFVTFHQSYSYEEFVEGIRPDLCETTTETKFTKVDGVFKQICEKARNHPKNDFFLIIDEINRGNISKIFGELITCLEKDKRLGPNNIKQENSFPVTLPYSKEKDDFCVPWNLYIIGTMNTADKSIALVDVALRRRFGFIEVNPDTSLIEQIEINGVPLRLPEILDAINEKISILIDRDHRIGHSYLIKIKQNIIGEPTEDQEIILKNIKIAFYNEIFPLITEYFYNDWEKIKAILKNFVEEKKTIDDAQEILADANQGIYSIKELDGDEFITSLNSLTETK